MEVDNFRLPYTAQQCRLCLETSPGHIPHTIISSFELYMLKQCVPDLVLDITLKPMKMCQKCLKSLSHFYRMQQTWQSEQKKLLARFILLARKVSYTDKPFRTITEKDVNSSWHKFYCCRNGIFELYQQTDDATLFPATSLNVDSMLPVVLKFKMDPKDNCRLKPVCEASKRVEALLLVPKDDFSVVEKEMILRLTLIAETSIDLRNINYAIVFYLGCEKEKYFKVEYGLASSSSVSLPKKVSSDNVTVTFCEAKDAPPQNVCSKPNYIIPRQEIATSLTPEQEMVPHPKDTTSIHFDLTLGKEMSLPDLTAHQEMAPPVEAATPTDLNCEEQMEISDDEDVEALLNEIPEIDDEPEDCPDYVAITHCIQREDGQIVMANEEETVVGQATPLPPPLPTPAPVQENQPVKTDLTPVQQHEPEKTDPTSVQQHEPEKTDPTPVQQNPRKRKITDRPKKHPVVKVEDCFTEITEFKISNDGYYIEDHDYLPHPYKRNNYFSDHQTYCNICRVPHHMAFHESHMSNHKKLQCTMHKKHQKFDNIYMLNQHMAKHVQECKLCGMVVAGEFRAHSTRHRFGNASKTERPRTSYFDFQLPKITKVESLSEVDPT